MTHTTVSPPMTFSQCNCVSSGVMRSYLAENTSRAAEFNTDCIRLVRGDGMPASELKMLKIWEAQSFGKGLGSGSLANAVEREMKPVTVERSAELSDEYSAVDAESQNRQLQSSRRATSSTHQRPRRCRGCGQWKLA